MMKLKNFCFLLSVLLIPVIFLSGCEESFAPGASYWQELEKPVDYSREENWIIFPQAELSRHEVDVFYAIPTIFAQKKYPYLDWRVKYLRKKAEIIAHQQVGPFVEDTRIYAPFYRQCEISRALNEIGKKREEQHFMHCGYQDIRDAFAYYLKHHNKGRPFILVGHSQGAYVLLDLMKEVMKDPAIREKLVAAYLFGYPRMPKSFPDAPYLKLAERADDVGVIITWNSEAPGVKDSIFTGPGTYCINPLNWRTDSVKAEPSQSVGAVFFDRNGRIVAEERNFCSAQINPETGALIVIPANPGKFDSKLLGNGVYHMNDIFFFFHDITKNVQVRIKAHKARQK